MQILDSLLNFLIGGSNCIALARHGEGTHLTGGYFNKKFGPSLTGRWDATRKEYTGGKGQSYRRIARQLAQKQFNPTLILVSPQMRALETIAFARKNTKIKLNNGKYLKDIPIRILRGPYSCHEQTRCLHGQGNIVAPIELADKWPNIDVLKEDEALWRNIEISFSGTTKQPAEDPRGSAVPRAMNILSHLENDRKFKNECILLVAHDGICRDIIYAKYGKRTDVMYLAEVRLLNDYSPSYPNGPKKKIRGVAQSTVENKSVKPAKNPVKSPVKKKKKSRRRPPKKKYIYSKC